MSNQPMKGVRILEVAQFTFVPMAGGVLSDWGADVIKVEHAERGDAQRGLTAIGRSAMGVGSFRPIMEHPNRGKRSIGLALEQESALDILYELARESDVFLTNFLPAARRRLKIDVADIRAVNPDIIYVRGSGFGARGPDAEKGGYDGTAFWSRGGSAAGVTPPELDEVGSLFMPAGAYGDTMGGTIIAGGIAAALFGRAQSGDPSIIDVSLLSVGAWAVGLNVDLSLLSGEAVPPRSLEAAKTVTNPIHGQFRTADGRWIQLSMLQPSRYWAEVCRVFGREELIDDERFDTPAGLSANAVEGHTIITEEIAKHTLAELTTMLQGTEGPWAPVQNSLEVANDEQLRANGYIRPVVDADGVERRLLANPVQFDETAPDLVRAPQFAEHTDDVLRELGRTDDEIIELKIDGAVT
jgi:crotonobetainyl-CoA:carnitine CoA-transferase CaiB-like acyl-CoA transferase